MREPVTPGAPGDLFKTTAQFVAELRRRLPASVFQPATSRVLWLPVHALVILAGMITLTRAPSLELELLLAAIMGLSFGGLAFVAHEALHGALVRSSRARYLLGWIGFLPFGLSPRLWIAWHNRVHHSQVNRLESDPDRLATLEEYNTNRAVYVSTWIQRRTRGLATLLLGFTAQSWTVLTRARRAGILSAAHSRRAWLETGLNMAFWVVVALLVGPRAMVFGFVLPLLIGNAIVMAHIVTNHGLSQLAVDDDPLKTSLSVTVPRWFSFYTLDFGYHVEHHLLPGVSHRHGPAIRSALREMAGARYQSLPLSAALLRYFRQARLYRDTFTLLDPETNATLRALGDAEPATPPASSPERGAWLH